MLTRSATRAVATSPSQPLPPTQEQAQEQPPSPADMDITQPLPAVAEEQEEERPAVVTGDITAALPSLAGLAEADELEEQQQQREIHGHMYGNDDVTSAVPGLGLLVEEDEQREEQEQQHPDMELTVALGHVVSSSSTKKQQQQQSHRYDDTLEHTLPPVPEEEMETIFIRANPTPSPPPPPPLEGNTNTMNNVAPAPPSPLSQDTEGGEYRQEGLANKWGFAPGDDDTMELDLEEHGRRIMGDKTYAGMYGDGDGTTVFGGRAHLDDDNDGVRQQEEQEEGEEGEKNAEQAMPNWTAPAFLPPYMMAEHEQVPAAEGGADHPALHQSPGFTNSSLNTLSTRRISVDVARRASVTSRRASMATGLFVGGGTATGGIGGDTAALLAASGIHLQHAENNGGDTGKLSDVTEDLLADDDEERGSGGGNDAGVGVGDQQQGGGNNNNSVLAGLHHQMRLLSRGSPAPRAEDMLHATHSPRPHTATGTTTGGLLADSTIDPNDEIGGGGDHQFTRNTQGTTGLLWMDATAASAIATGAKTLLQQEQQQQPDEDVTAPIVSPTRNPHHLMTHSPPASALSNGSMGRAAAAYLSQHNQLAMAAASHRIVPPSPAVLGSVLSIRSGSVVAGLHNNNNHNNNALSYSHNPPPSILRQQQQQQQQQHTPNGSVLQHQRRLTRTPGSAMGPAGSVSMLSQGAGGTQGPYAAPPGSAIAARYPGSAIAQGRLSQGFTPSIAPPITFQDFAKIVEVQFLDNLRRGSSINYADLAPNPVPGTLTEAYSLLCITSPNLAELETAVHTLRSEASRLRSSASELEVMLGTANPPIFRHIQTATLEQLEAFRTNVGLLKKVCRAKAVVLLKDVRCQMEDSKASRLARAADGLRVDLAFVEEQAKHTAGVAAAADKFARDTRDHLAVQAEARGVESERRRRVGAARAALEQARAANVERMRRLEEAVVRSAELRREREHLAAERTQIETATAAVRSALAKLSSLAIAGGKDPRAVLVRMQAVVRLEGWVGMKVEQTANGGAELCLRVGPVFRVRLSVSPAGVRGTVQALLNNNTSGGGGGGGSGAAMRKMGVAQRSMAASLAGVNSSTGSTTEVFFVDPAGVPAAVQALVARLQRCTELAEELRGIRSSCKHLCEVTSTTTTQGGGVCFLFCGLHAEVRFSVTLTLGASYPLGPLVPLATKIFFDGGGQLGVGDVNAAVARAPLGPGRIRAVCAALSELVEGCAPRTKSGGAYRTAWGNPLFGDAQNTTGNLLPSHQQQLTTVV